MEQAFDGIIDYTEHYKGKIDVKIRKWVNPS